MVRPVVSIHDLAPNARLVDARSGPDSTARFERSHLRGAVHVDLDRDLAGPAAAPSTGGRHPLPALPSFAATLGRLGIRPDTGVVVYDDKRGANAAARFYWMLRAVGHDAVALLDGGLDAALAAGAPTEAGPSKVEPAPAYPVSEWSLPTADIDEVAARAHDPGWLVLDVRSHDRYRGDAEPIDPVAGHIPGAANLFFGENLAPDGTFLTPEALGERYRALFGAVPPSRVIVSCGSGVTACHTLVALERAGLPGARLYVGSFGEWCRAGRPIATGDEPG